MKKRILSMLLSIVMVFTMLSGMSLTANAADVTATLDSNGVLTISGSGSFEDDSYAGNSSIKEVIIEDGVTSICGYAFSGCTELKSVTIAGSVHAIGPYAFYYCQSLTTVKYLGTEEPTASSNVFYGCLLSEIVVPSEYDSFSFCGFPVTSIEPVNPGNKYNITFPGAENGTVTASFPAAVAGSTVTLTVNPDEGYTLDSLTVSSSTDTVKTTAGENGTYTFTMPASDVEIKAVFEDDPNTYRIIIAENIVHGKLTANKYVAAAGEQVTLTATPDEGYEKGQYTTTMHGYGSISLSGDILTMPACDVTVSVTFQDASAHKVRLPANPGYTVSRTSDTVYPIPNGGTYSFIVRIWDGYEKTEKFTVSEWNSKTILTPDDNGIYTISNVDKDLQIVVGGVLPIKPDSPDDFKEGSNYPLSLVCSDDETHSINAPYFDENYAELGTITGSTGSGCYLNVTFKVKNYFDNKFTDHTATDLPETAVFQTKWDVSTKKWYYVNAATQYTVNCAPATHEHNLSYTAKNKVITEKCDDGCGHSATATISIREDADLYFTGQIIEGPAKVEYSPGWQGGELTIDYGKEIKYTGLYRPSITKNDAKAKTDFQIVYYAPEATLTYERKAENAAWAKGATLTAPEGHLIASSRNGEFVDSLTLGNAYSNSTPEYFIKKTGGDKIYRLFVSNYNKVDGTKPTVNSASADQVTHNSATVTVTAGWEAPNASPLVLYTLCLNGKEPMTSANGVFNLTELTPETDYSFTCSITDDAGNVSEEGTGTFTTKEVPTVTVTFNANGHGTEPDTQVIDNGACVTKPTDPIKTGYTFGGWYKESGCTNLWDFANDTATENITLYAKWTPNTYTVKFNPNGGSGTMADQSFTYGVSQNMSTNVFTKTNKHFNGWNTAADGNGTAYTDGQPVSNLSTTNGGIVTLYAQWSNKPAQTINFDTSDRTAIYGDGTLEARTATAAGTITYFSSDETIAAVDTSGVVTVLKAGEVTITANAAETNAYAAGSASYKLAVAPKPLTITVTNKSAYVGSQKPDLSAAVAGTDYTVIGLTGSDTLSVTLSYVTEPDMTKSGEYAITATASDSNYTITVDEGKLIVSYRPSSGGSSNTTTKTEKNEDGSTTTTTTNKATGTVTETTKYPDGSAATVETKKDGSTTETNKAADGTTGITKTNKDGKVTEVSAKVPAAAADKAEKNGEAVTLPIEVPAADSNEDAAEIKVDVPTDGATVEIPVEDLTGGTVVIIVNADGTEEIIKASAVSDTGVVVTLEKDATIKVIDNSKYFVDVHPVDHWAEEAVDFVVAREIYSGTSATTFHPDNAMTRGMLAVVLHRLEDSPEHSYDGRFPDVAEGSWYEDGIHWAAENGIVSGYGNGNYGPEDNITREQLAVMLWRYAGSPEVEHDLSHFVDEHKISSYAREALEWASANGIVNGKGGNVLDPKGNATRAQVAQMLKNFITSWSIN